MTTYQRIPGRTDGPDVLAGTWGHVPNIGPSSLRLRGSVHDVPADREHTDHTTGACRAISISGSVKSGRGRDEGGGQNVDDLAALLADPSAVLAMPRADLESILEAWRAWHLSDMLAGCDHQGDEWTCHGDRNETARAEAVRSLTYKADNIERQARDLAHDEAARELRAAAARLREHAENVGAAIPREACDTLNGWPVIRSLFGEHAWPNTGTRCYVCSRDRWDEPSAACPVTGYRFGTAWLVRPAPDSVVDLLIRALRVPYSLPVAA